MKAPKRARRIMKRMEKLSLIQERAAQQYQEQRTALLKEFAEVNEDEFVVDDGQDKVLKGKTWEATSVSYDLGILRKVLPKAHLKRVIRVSVDSSKVQELYDLGLVEPDVLRAAATVRSTTNVSVRRVKRSIGDSES